MSRATNEAWAQVMAASPAVYTQRLRDAMEGTARDVAWEVCGEGMQEAAQRAVARALVWALDEDLQAEQERESDEHLHRIGDDVAPYYFRAFRRLGQAILELFPETKGGDADENDGPERPGSDQSPDVAPGAGAESEQDAPAPTNTGVPKVTEAMVREALDGIQRYARVGEGEITIAERLNAMLARAHEQDAPAPSEDTEEQRESHFRNCHIIGRKGDGPLIVGRHVFFDGYLIAPLEAVTDAERNRIAERASTAPSEGSKGEVDALRKDGPEVTATFGQDTEGTEGEVEPDSVMNCVAEWLDARKSLSDNETRSIYIGDVRHLYETVQRLQKEKNDWIREARHIKDAVAARVLEIEGLQQRHDEIEKMYRNRDGRLEEAREEIANYRQTLQQFIDNKKELRAEIARLRDPRNWEVRRYANNKVRAFYVGPPESEGESDG